MTAHSEPRVGRGEVEVDERLAAILAAEARYRVVVAHLRDVVIQTDLAGIIEYVSPSVRAWGYRPGDLVGRDARSLRHPDDHDRREEVIAAVVRGERRHGLEEFRLLRGDEGWIWVEVNPSLVHDAEDRPSGIVSVLRDISVRRALEDELHQRRTEAEAAAAVKTEFLANMSHEIRTPLTAVIGFAGLLNKIAGLPEKAQVYAERIVRSGEALSTIVNHILDFSRVEAGQVRLKRQVIAVQALLDETLGIVRDEAARKGLTLELVVDRTTPSHLLADPGRLAQVMLNLLNNAVKFTQAGGVVVQVAHAGEAETLRIEVRDTGIGVPEALRGRLFQRFSQVDGSNARSFGGAGLGLAICKGLVELMGGEIGLQSREGEGSTFWFTLAAPAALPIRTCPDQAHPELRSGKVLVVDDIEANRDLVAELLAPHGLNLTMAAGGQAAVHAARHETFDAILMDLQMPGMCGMAATRAIRESSDINRHTPILALSASVLPADIEACRAAGMDDHIAKPIDAADLTRKLARWMEAEPSTG